MGLSFAHVHTATGRQIKYKRAIKKKQARALSFLQYILLPFPTLEPLNREYCYIQAWWGFVVIIHSVFWKNTVFVENNKNLDFQTTVEYCVARGKIKKKSKSSLFFILFGLVMKAITRNAIFFPRNKIKFNKTLHSFLWL